MAHEEERAFLVACGEEMRRFGTEAGRELIADPMGGYLANLDPEDYKRFFRPRFETWAALKLCAAARDSRFAAHA